MSADQAARAAFMTDLAVASRKVRTLFDGLVRERGLTLARARLLMHVSKHGPVRQGELAALLELEHPTVVRLLDGLETQGLVVRLAVDGDRRAKQVTLTEAAEVEVVAMERITAEMREVLLAGIADEDLAAAGGVLARIVANIDGARS